LPGEKDANENKPGGLEFTDCQFITLLHPSLSNGKNREIFLDLPKFGSCFFCKKEKIMRP
jgi:hypothetical protein